MIFPPIYLAYFYQPQSVPVDGWYDRFTVVCDERGSMRNAPIGLYERMRDEHWIYLGHFPIGATPDNVWARARVRD